jgi:hypothetical protein
LTGHNRVVRKHLKYRQTGRVIHAHQGIGKIVYYREKGSIISKSVEDMIGNIGIQNLYATIPSGSGIINLKFTSNGSTPSYP